jgi:hypothetical protein
MRFNGLIRRGMIIGLALLPVMGCGSNSEQHADSRQAAQAAYVEAKSAFDARDYAAAEQKFSAAIDLRGLGADDYCDALIRRAACWGVAGKYDEALASLHELEAGGGPTDLINVARAFVLKKQGKAGEAALALARARRINRTIKEFQ